MKNAIKISIISAALISSLNAEQTVILEPLIITSTAIQTDELQSSDSVEIYDQTDIEESHAKDLMEFLNSHTSVIATPNYGNPFTPSIDMRGYGSNGNQNVVITLNGKRLNNVDLVPQLLSSISPASISRIEIIKGSGVVLGGDGANAGVINITTKKSNDKEISLYFGTHGLADGSFYLGQSDEILSIYASGELNKNDGMRYINAQGDKDANKMMTASRKYPNYAHQKS